MQTSTEEEQLTALKTSVESLTATQARLETAVSSFSASLTAASSAAEARDTGAISSLIQQGRLQMEGDEVKTQALLTEIVGNQNKVCKRNMYRPFRAGASMQASAYRHNQCCDWCILCRYRPWSSYLWHKLHLQQLRSSAQAQQRLWRTCKRALPQPSLLSRQL